MDESGNTTYCYNRFGDLVRKVQRVGNRTLTVRWQYAVNGRLLKVIRPGAIEVDYGYDSAGRVSEIGANYGAGRVVLLSGATYHPFGAPARWTYGNGRVMTRDVDLDYRASRIYSSTPGALDYAYAYNEVGNLAELKNGSTTALIRRYGYDGLDRLTDETVAGATTPLHAYTYDKTGNRTSKTQLVPVGSTGTGPGSSNIYQPMTFAYTYATGSHRLVHDVLGSARIRRGRQSDEDRQRQCARWSSEALRVQRSESSQRGFRLTPIATYAYNAMGERVRRTRFWYRNAESLRRVRPVDRLDYIGTAPQQQLIWLGNLAGRRNRRQRCGREALLHRTRRTSARHVSVVDPTRRVGVALESSKAKRSETKCRTKTPTATAPFQPRSALPGPALRSRKRHELQLLPRLRSG